MRSIQIPLYLALVTSSCSDDRERTVLERLSPSLAIDSSGMDLNRLVACRLGGAAPVGVDRLDTQCRIFQEATLHAQAVYRVTINNGVVPASIYKFTLLPLKEDGEGGSYVAEDDVGPFLDRSDCIRLESYARSVGVATRSCSMWTPRWGN